MAEETNLDREGRAFSLTRREAIRLVVAGVTASATPGAGSFVQAAPRDAFTFLVVNDIHYTDEACGEWLDRAVGRMKMHRPRPELCILAGDLAEHGTKSQLGAVREIFSALQIPIHVVIGNHDFVGARDRSSFDQVFPNRLNYRFIHRGWQFIGLDTTEGQIVYRVRISADTLTWIDRHLPAIERDRPTVVFTHLPLGPNLLRPTNAPRLIRKFAHHNVQAVFSGHWHGLTERRVGAATFTTNRCCSLRRHNHDGFQGKGYFLCLASDGAITRRFVEVQPA